MRTSIEPGEIRTAVEQNDTAKVASLFDEMGLPKEGERTYSNRVREFVTQVIGFASAMSYRHTLADGVLSEIVERTAVLIDTFFLAKLVLTAMGAEADAFDLNAIPEQIRTSLGSKYTSEAAAAIESLDNDAFMSLLHFIANDNPSDGMYAGFNRPIVSRLIATEVIPNHLLLLYMQISLREPPSCPKSIAMIDVHGELADGMPVIFEMLSGGFHPFHPF